MNVRVCVCMFVYAYACERSCAGMRVCLRTVGQGADCFRGYHRWGSYSGSDTGLCTEERTINLLEVFMCTEG